MVNSKHTQELHCDHMGGEKGAMARDCSIVHVCLSTKQDSEPLCSGTQPHNTALQKQL